MLALGGFVPEESSGTGNHWNVNLSSTEEPEIWRSFEATAYIALCDTGCSGITKTGIDVRQTVEYGGRRVVAVDPDVIPLGSALIVRLADGTEIEATAQDTGGRIRGNMIDILSADYDDAIEFGRQAVKIKIIEEESE